jgi:hypothetical protein
VVIARLGLIGVVERESAESELTMQFILAQVLAWLETFLVNTIATFLTQLFGGGA